MEKGNGSSGKRTSMAVQLKICYPVNSQKGCTLVGRLETDKNLNRGIVISMIKKGWGIDRNMEVHEMPDSNAFLFRFTSQSDYIKILKGRPWSILGALLKLQTLGRVHGDSEVDLVVSFWIRFHGLLIIILMTKTQSLGQRSGRGNDREPVWVTIKYERLQIYCYDCGRIGHEAKSCKFPVAGLDYEDAADNRVGPGLGTPHVKTKDHSLVAHDSQWNEFPPETSQAAAPPAAAAAIGIPLDRSEYGETSRKGKIINSGDKSARPLWGYPDMEAGTNLEFNGINHAFNGIKAPGNSHNSGETSRKGKIINSGDESARTLLRYPDMEAGTNQEFNGINHAFNDIKAPGNGHSLKKDLVNASMNKERNLKIVELSSDMVTANMVEELKFQTAMHQVLLSSPINSLISINQGPVIRHLPTISDPDTHQPKNSPISINQGPIIRHLPIIPDPDIHQPKNSPFSINQGPIIRHLPIISDPDTHQPNTNSDPGTQQPTTIPGPGTHNSPISASAPITQHLPEPMDIPVSPSYHVEFPENDDVDPPLLPLPISGLSPLSAVTTGLNRIHLKRHHDPFEDDQVLNPTKKRLLFLEPASNTTPPISSGTRSANCRRTKSHIRSAKGKSRFNASKVPPIGNSSHPPPPIISPDHVNISPPPFPAPEKTPDGSWDVSPLRHVLDDRAIEAILTIPIPRAPIDDRQRWLLSKNGVYSVKSGYFSLASAPTVITPTVTHLSSEIWKATGKSKQLQK
ncbi:hypothetical protein K1719_030446 [Acacia pycnantha]|nr:hypothetical protein K1719_030446 [Acacia pycnantha]